MAAGLKTKTNKVGFVGGVKGPIIDPFAAGYQAGVKAVNPKATVEMKWLSDQADARGVREPAGWQDRRDGALRRRRGHRLPRLRPVRQRRLRGGRGREQVAIGVDSDQYLTAPKDQQPHILTSALKRVDVAVYDFVQGLQGRHDKRRFRRLRPEA